MLNRIIRFSVRNKLLVGIGTLLLVIAGIIAFQKLPIDAVPDITDNQVLVITTTPGLGAPDVERFITFPIEQSTRNIPGIKEQRSFSRFGLSLVTIVFNDQTDVYWARQQVSERLVQVQQEIPKGMGVPTLGPVTTGLGEIFQYVVKAKKGYEEKYSLSELRTIQDWIVRRQLLGTKGVADVSSFGGSVKQYEVAVRSDQLKSMGLTIADVFHALESNNQNTGGAYIEKGDNVLFIRTEGLVSSIDDIENIVIKRVNADIPILVRDIATVNFGEAIRYGATVYNDEGEVAGAVVMMLKGENSNEVVKAIKEKIQQIETTLPEGVKIEAFLDRTKMVNNAISTVKTNLLEGALIVIFVLVLFLGNLRAGLIVASVIPLSLLFALILMNLTGTSGNLMSLGALDFGLLVDGAVIIVEAVLHKLKLEIPDNKTHQLSQVQMDDEVGKSASGMMNAAAFGQLIILVVYLPILSLQGIEGKMFRPMAETVSFSIIGALLLSLTYVPMMSALFLSKKIKSQDSFTDKWMYAASQWYKNILGKVLAIPKIIIGINVLLFAVSIWLLTTLGGEFIPKLEEGDFAVDTRLLTGASLNSTVKVSQKAARLLLDSFPEVKKVVTKIGAGEIPTDPMPMEAADMMVILQDKKQWVSAKSFDELAEKMSSQLQQIPGITTGFQFPVQMRFNELMTGARQDVVCKVFGDDLDSLSTIAGKLSDKITTIEGAKDIYVETVTGIPQWVITYNRAAIARFGASIADINATIESAYAGAKSGIVFEGDKRFDMVIRLDKSQRLNTAEFDNLLVGVANGLQVPLNQLATVSLKDGPYQIQREDGRRRITVGFNVRGKDVQTIVQTLQDKIKQTVKLPAGYYITYGGQYENLQHATSRLAIAVPIALLLILILLYITFGKLSYGLLIFSAIPLSATGGIISLWLRGMPFSISAGVGFIALFGVAVLNGIVMITEIRKQKLLYPDHAIQQIIMEATVARLRPILMTAAVASLGFLPMALSNGAGAEVQRPLATVVIGGLITATLLTLLVLPCLFLLLDNKKTTISIKTICWLATILVPIAGIAQGPTAKASLPELLQKASEKSAILKVGRMQEQYYSTLKESYREIPKTQFSTDLGSYNTYAFDAKVSVMQPLAPVGFYQKQKNVLESFFQTAQANTKLQEADVKKSVRQIYTQLQYQQAAINLLVQLDSSLAPFQKIAALRLEKGETNLLEKTVLDNLVMQNKLLITQQYAEKRATQQQLSIILQTDTVFTPSDPLQSNKQLFDSVQWRNNPLLAFYKSQENQFIAETEMAKVKLKPDWMIGYSNQSLSGWQMRPDRTERLYDVGNRFSFITVAMSLPVFSKAQKQKVKAASINEMVATASSNAVSNMLQTKVQAALGEYERYAKAVDYYQQIGKKQADLLIKTANLNYKNGQIGYIEWGTLINQSIQINMQQLEAIRMLHITAAELHYLLNN
ncbi:MAG: hypothetical protein RL596_975 [Bacteroidota bacterium]